MLSIISQNLINDNFVTASLYIGQLFAMQRQQLEILKEFYVKSLTCTCINYFKVALADGNS